MRLVLLIIILCFQFDDVYCSIDTLVLHKNMFRTKAMFRILMDEAYHYNEAQSKLLEKDYQDPIIPSKLLRSFPDYWMAIYVQNNTDNSIEILAEAYFAEAWLDGQKQVSCGYVPCQHPRSLLVDSYSNMAYFLVAPGTHLMIVKISDYHLPAHFSPLISTASDYEGVTYIRSIVTIFIFSFILGSFSLIAILGFTLFYKLEEKSLLWYALYSLVIVISGYFSLQSKYQTFYWSYQYIPWFYLKMFVAMGLYITYVQFAKHFTDIGPIMLPFQKKADLYVKIGLILMIPEIILMGMGEEKISYSYYYFARMGMAIYGIYLIYDLWKYRYNVYAQFILAGSVFLVAGELISNFAPRIYSAHIATGGAIIESIIFTIGIGYKIHKHYQRERLLDEELLLKQVEIKYLSEEKDNLNLSLLQSQMNPHFMFNALNSINRFIIKSEKDKASYYLSRFSKLMRAILDHSEMREVSLAEEIDTIKLYLELENLRFNNMIEYTFNIDADIYPENEKIPPLIVQPFIENSILHGFNKINYQGKIQINISKLNNQLKIVIEDNGVGRANAEKKKHKRKDTHKSMGLHITNDRIKNYAKMNNTIASVEIEDLYLSNGDAAGTKVVIIL